MTEALATGPAVDAGAPSARQMRRRAIAYGTGFGIAVDARNLEVAIVRARPSGAAPVGTVTIADFRNRPAAEWGAELLRFVTAAGETRLAATVLIPRSEVIVRVVHLPGVADKDVPAAIDLQVDTLHPWGDAEIVSAWSRVAGGDVMVGLARRETVDGYETLFTEAGIPLAAITFSPAAIHAALRIWSAGAGSLLCFAAEANGRTEVYGESESRALFSADFSVPRERALAMARAELRLAPDYPASPLASVLPAGDSQRDPLAHAAALAGAVPRIARMANLLPPERRASHNRIQYLLPAVLGLLLMLGLIAVFVVFPAVEQRRYKADLDSAARRLEPAALRLQAIDRKTAENRTRTQLLDEIQRRPQADLEVLDELTRLLPAQAWTSSIEIYPDSVMISGEADQAAPLLKLLDSSPLFQNSEFQLSVTRTNQNEQFRIKTTRRGRAGRVAP